MTLHDFGNDAADFITKRIGAWPYIIGQNLFYLIWGALNVLGIVHHWDPYPFILLNLIMSWTSSNLMPIILMSQNRQEQRDRVKAERDLSDHVNRDKIHLATTEAVEALVEVTVQKQESIDQRLQHIEAHICRETS